METTEDKVKETPANKKSGYLDPTTHKFAVGNPGGGRPFGSKNKFTRMKEEMLDCWIEAGGKDRFRNLMKADKTFLQAVDRVIAIMPKERELPSEDVSVTQVVINNITVQNTQINHTNGTNP